MNALEWIADNWVAAGIAGFGLMASFIVWMVHRLDVWLHNQDDPVADEHETEAI